jgi:hypothetical protein
LACNEIRFPQPNILGEQAEQRADQEVRGA